MTKRILLLLLTLAMLMCSAPVQAANDVHDRVYQALYRIIQRTDAGDIVVGSGVLFLEQNMILTAESCCVEGPLYAVGNDGEHAVQSVAPVSDTGAVLLTLATPSSAEPLALSNYDANMLYSVFGTDALGNTGYVPLQHLLYGIYRGKEALVLSAEDGPLPGGVVVDEKGGIVALTVAQQGEGWGMYTALDADKLYYAMTGVSDRFLPMTASWSSGFLTVSWTDAGHTGGMYVVTISGDDNTYYTSFEAENTARSLQFAVPPGHTYYVQTQWVESADDAMAPMWSAMTTYTVPELPLQQYAFTQECYLATAPAGQTVTEVLPESGFIPLDQTDVARYLQIINRYDVHQDMEYPMSLELIAPDGQFFFSEHWYMFSPEYEENDCFALPLDGLLNSCARFSGGRLPEGEYRVRYAIAGKIAGECVFTVE